MYRPPAFDVDDPATLLAMAREIGFACLVTPSDGGVQVTHAPVVVREGAIELHVARANPHRRHAGGGSVAIFQGPSAYVHPGWYPSKARTGKVVPTWLYTAVHARGALAVMEAEETARHLAELTDAHEGTRERPWAVSDAPPDYLAKMERAIVGLRLAVEAWEGVRKLNQHKGEPDRACTRDGLLAEGSVVGTMME